MFYCLFQNGCSLVLVFEKSNYFSKSGTTFATEKQPSIKNICIIFKTSANNGKIENLIINNERIRFMVILGCSTSHQLSTYFV